MLPCIGVQSKHRWGKLCGSTVLGVVGSVGENNREEDCMPDRLDGGYVAHASCMLECRTIAMLSENLSSCVSALSDQWEWIGP